MDNQKVLKCYDSERKLFCISERNDAEETVHEITFSTFDDFYEHLKGDLDGCNLKGFDFKDVHLMPDQIKNCLIDSNALSRMGIYDDTFYKNNISRESELKYLVPIPYEAIPVIGSDKESIVRKTSYRSNDCVIHYIFDIHLDYKILKKFPERATEHEVAEYIDGITEILAADFNDIGGKYSFVLIGGDVSNRYKITKMFYTSLSNRIPSEKIVSVLGNHELWDTDSKSNLSDVDATIEKYESMFKKLGINFLQDSVLIFNRYADNYILSGEEVKKSTLKKIRSLCENSAFVIMGGVGFAGLNEEFNASHGLYRATLTSRDEEKTLSLKFKETYLKLRRALPRKDVVVFTHMPMENWNDGEHENGWYYLSGHTHRNRYIEDNDIHVYENNQIGYHNNTIRLKHFKLGGSTNNYRFYPDGIHAISADDYYAASPQIYKFEKIYMLKRDGFYMYFGKLNGKRYLLEGGKYRNIKNTDLVYYYKRLPEYGNNLVRILEPYMNLMKDVSKGVKTLYGSGKIHGCIVDIDFYNHVYVNPADLKLTPYYATDMVNKFAYPSLKDLLEDKVPRSYRRYLRLKKGTDEKRKLLDVFDSSGIIKSGADNPSIDYGEYLDTDIYRQSRIMSRLQYTYDYKIIREWNEKLVPVSGENLIGESDILMIDHVTEDISCTNPAQYDPYSRLIVEEIIHTMRWLEKSREAFRYVGDSYEGYSEFKDGDRQMIRNIFYKFHVDEYYSFPNGPFETALDEAIVLKETRKRDVPDYFESPRTTHFELQHEYTVVENKTNSYSIHERIGRTIRSLCTLYMGSYIFRVLDGDADHELLIEGLYEELLVYDEFRPLGPEELKESIIEHVGNLLGKIWDHEEKFRNEVSNISENEIKYLTSLDIADESQIKNIHNISYGLKHIIVLSAYYLKSALSRIYSAQNTNSDLLPDVDLLYFYTITKLRNKNPKEYLTNRNVIKYIVMKTVEVVIESYERQF